MVKIQKKNAARTTQTSFGPVSRINTAPVAVGNSVRGTKPIITQSVNGARVVGRDFAFTAGNTSAGVVDWEIIGSIPLTPCAFPSTILRNYCQMYSEFKINSMRAHFITSSPTSQAGDVMFFYEKQRIAPMIDYTNNSFLPFVLSDPNTIIGPQWTNHTADMIPDKEWKTTLFGSSTDLNEECAGTLNLFSKTNTANSPGYVLLDYDISFKNVALNPRFGVLPVARAIATPMCLTAPATTTAANAANWTYSTGKTVGAATSALPNGGLIGDVYKLVVQLQSSTVTGNNAAWTATSYSGVTSDKIVQYADDTAITLDDGTVFYGLISTTNNMRLFSTIDQARLNASPLEWQQTGTSVAINLCVLASLVTNVDDFQESSYPG
jgi:hypothetical protein